MFCPEIVKIKLILPNDEDLAEQGKTKRSSELFPQTLSFRFRFGDDDVSMDLEKNVMASVPPIMNVENHRPVFDNQTKIQVQVRDFLSIHIFPDTITEPSNNKNKNKKRHHQKRKTSESKK